MKDIVILFFCLLYTIKGDAQVIIGTPSQIYSTRLRSSAMKAISAYGDMVNAKNELEDGVQHSRQRFKTAYLANKEYSKEAEQFEYWLNRKDQYYIMVELLKVNNRNLSGLIGEVDDGIRPNCRQAYSSYAYYCLETLQEAGLFPGEEEQKKARQKWFNTPLLEAYLVIRNWTEMSLMGLTDNIDNKEQEFIYVLISGFGYGDMKEKYGEYSPRKMYNDVVKRYGSASKLLAATKEFLEWGVEGLKSNGFADENNIRATKYAYEYLVKGSREFDRENMLPWGYMKPYVPDKTIPSSYSIEEKYMIELFMQDEQYPFPTGVPETCKNSKLECAIDMYKFYSGIFGEEACRQVANTVLRYDKRGHRHNVFAWLSLYNIIGHTDYTGYPIRAICYTLVTHDTIGFMKWGIAIKKNTTDLNAINKEYSLAVTKHKEEHLLKAAEYVLDRWIRGNFSYYTNTIYDDIVSRVSYFSDKKYTVFDARSGEKMHYYGVFDKTKPNIIVFYSTLTKYYSKTEVEKIGRSLNSIFSDINYVAISFEESAVTPALDGWNFPVYINKSRDLKELYDCQTVPFTIIIDIDGTIQGKYIGQNHAGEITNMARGLVKENKATSDNNSRKRPR